MEYPRDSIAGRLLEGDEASLRIVSRWISRALTASRFRTLRHLWVDLHQEVIVHVVKSLRRERFDSSLDLRLYVEAITRYTAQRELRRSYREAGGAADAPAAPAPAPASVADRILVAQALSRLSNACRSLLSRYFLEERSYEEISSELGVPVGTIKSRLHRCLEAACRELGQHRRSRRPEGVRRGESRKGMEPRTEKPQENS